MAALICIKRVRGTFFQLVNIANRFLRIFSNIEASIRFIFPGGAGYPYLPTRLTPELNKFRYVWFGVLNTTCLIEMDDVKNLSKTIQNPIFKIFCWGKLRVC